MSGLVEINFDGIVGPTHNYAGLSPGNIASASHRGDASFPRAAALQPSLILILRCRRIRRSKPLWSPFH